MSEQILEQYGRVTIYTEANHPSPIYHVEGDIQPNPYGDLAALFEDDSLEEVMSTVSLGESAVKETILCQFVCVMRLQMAVVKRVSTAQVGRSITKETDVSKFLSKLSKFPD